MVRSAPSSGAVETDSVAVGGARLAYVATADGLAEKFRAKLDGAHTVARIALGRAAGAGGGAADDAFQADDLVLIEKASAGATGEKEPNAAAAAAAAHAFGWVEAVETGPGSWSGTGGGRPATADGDARGVRVRVRCCVDEFPGGVVDALTGGGSGALNDPRERNRREQMRAALSRPNTPLRVSKLASLTPPLREMRALIASHASPLRRRLFGSAAATNAIPRGSSVSVHAVAGVGPAPDGVPADVWTRVASGLNDPQRAAVRATCVAASRARNDAAAASAPASAVLIQGPPGTGKTRAIAAIVDVVLSSGSDKRVLVCAQSNGAVDEILARLAKDAKEGGGGSSESSPRRRAIVRLGREEVAREDAKKYLATRLANDERAAASASARNAAAAASKPSEGGGGGETASSLRARLEKLGDEIKKADDASCRQLDSIQLDALHARRRLMLGELALATRRERVAEESRERVAGGAWTRVVGGASVVCATLSGAGSLAADGGRGDRRGRNKAPRAAAIAAADASSSSHYNKAGCAVPLFDVVVVDEAAQATEPSTLVPARWIKPGGVFVLVGDPKQLAPTVLCRERAVSDALAMSLFERLQANGAIAHALTVQYRMTPEIRAFPSAEFYGGALVDGRERPRGVRTRTRTLRGATDDDDVEIDVDDDVAAAVDASSSVHVHVHARPYVVVDVRHGVERRGAHGGSGGSLSNAAEAKLAAEAYVAIKTRAAAARSNVVSVCLVTPYRDQIAALRAALARHVAAHDAKWAPAEFATVDGVQGREFDCVILSCVRARGGGGAGFDDDDGDDGDDDDASAAARERRSRRTIGFLGDARRLNVALTRPRDRLIVLGHAATLRRADETWARLWTDAERRGCAFYHAALAGRTSAGQPRRDGARASSASSFFDALLPVERGTRRDEEEERRRPDPPPRKRARGTEAAAPVDVVDLVSEEEEEEEEEAVAAAAPPPPIPIPPRARVAAASAAPVAKKRARGTTDDASTPAWLRGSGVLATEKKKPATGGSTAPRRAVGSVPVAPITSVTKRMKATTTTTTTTTTAAATAGLDRLSAPAVGERRPAAAPRRASVNVLGGILKSMKKTNGGGGGR